MKYLISSVISLFLALPVMAEQTAVPPKVKKDRVARLKLAHELVIAMDTPQAASSLYKKMAEQLGQQLLDSDPKMTQKSVNVWMKVVSDQQEKMLTGPEGVIDKISFYYARTFSQDELKQLVAFHQSPAGKKFQRALPTLLKQSNEAILQSFHRHMPQMRQEFVSRVKQANTKAK